MHDDNFMKGSRGEFRGDCTRDTFDPLKRFSRVLMQQGRVQLDADWNEQVSINIRYLRMLGAHFMGPHGAPCTVNGNPGKGFEITGNGSTFNIAAGHYYVNGILCENDKENLPFRNQPDLPFTPAELEKSWDPGGYLVYLDVWERHLSYVEDDYMREKALGGSDTTTRAKIVWQVKVKKHEAFKESKDDNKIDPAKFKTNYERFLTALTMAKERKPGSGRLKARARKTPEDNKNPCLTSPEAQYRGAENQLYRVEIHKDSVAKGGPTFKWSRENSSVVFPVTGVSDKKINLEHLGRDNRFSLKPNDWVEMVDDDESLRNNANALLQIIEIDSESFQVTFNDPPEWPGGFDQDKHPYLRRWDQRNGDSGGVPVKGGNTKQDWILLEDGVEIQFPLADEDNEKPYVYQTGDYWLIPVRTATGDVEWPGKPDAPDPLPPQGVEHHYAPLGNITVDASGDVNVPDDGDLRRILKTNW